MESLAHHRRVLAISRLVDRWAEEHLYAEEPEWGPLEAAVPLEWCGGFMWMSRVEQDGRVIELYKHGITRRYLNLDHDGTAYRNGGDEYIELPLETAVESVFQGLEEMGWSRSTVYDEEFRLGKYRALREAGWTVISTDPFDS